MNRFPLCVALSTLLRSPVFAGSPALPRDKITSTIRELPAHE